MGSRLHQLVEDAIAYDDEDLEIKLQHVSRRLQEWDFYRRDRIINKASAALCVHRGELMATIRGCSICREAVAKVYDARVRRGVTV